jgi:hypothetical protein
MPRCPQSLVALAILGLSSLSHAAPPIERPIDSGTVEFAAPIRVAVPHRTTLIPRGCGSRDGNVDVLVHFHGVETAMSRAYLESDLQSVLVIVNLGEFSDPYETHFAESGSLNRLLGQVETTLKHYCPSAHLARVALSAWSGGYGAVYRILNHEAEAARVDAVLLADGLHVGFTNKRTRQLNDLQMAAFTRFAEQAVHGERLFAITHTQIKTPYASTAETADYLLRANRVARTALDAPGPLPSMTLTSRGIANGLTVLGYQGSDVRAHCDHLHAIGRTLLPLLRARWSRIDHASAEITPKLRTPQNAAGWFDVTANAVAALPEDTTEFWSSKLAS